MTRELYDEAYFDMVRGSKQGTELHHKFFELVKEVAAGRPRILDLGCGRGQLLSLLAREPGMDVSGLDFSEAAVAASQELVEPERVHCGSAAERDNFPQDSFDLICIMDVVEHLPPADLLATMENIRYWLKPGGHLVVHTFPTLGPHRIFQAILRLSGQRDYLNLLNKIHCNVQTRASLRQVLEQAGLEPERLWLQNDFTLTSSSYQRLRNGPLKRFLGFLLDTVLDSPLVTRLLKVLGLLEYARPSIYCIARK